MNNSKVYTLYGVSMTRPLWCAYMGINYDTVVHRMRGGMTLEDALTTPLVYSMNSKLYNYKGEKLTLTEISNKAKIGLGNLRLMLKEYNSLELVLDRWESSKSYDKNIRLLKEAEYKLKELA